MAESSQIHRLGLVQPCSSWECTERPVGRHSGVLSQVPGTDSLLEIPRAVAGNEMNFALEAEDQLGALQTSLLSCLQADLKGDWRERPPWKPSSFSGVSFTEHFQCGAGFPDDACRISYSGLCLCCLCFLQQGLLSQTHNASPEVLPREVRSAGAGRSLCSSFLSQALFSSLINKYPSCCFIYGIGLNHRARSYSENPPVLPSLSLSYYGECSTFPWGNF